LGWGNIGNITNSNSVNISISANNSKSQYFSKTG